MAQVTQQIYVFNYMDIQIGIQGIQKATRHLKYLLPIKKRTPIQKVNLATMFGFAAQSGMKVVFVFGP
ncbi:hypothetical protein Syun_012333 [Stephania yunnanensis]|uniref:Uncharacterized protein n=1 Tax=Stephania yunnanensis TaxID=152371 RepID=A0AAP0JZ82_9MAGN